MRRIFLAILVIFTCLPLIAERPKQNPYEKYFIFWGYPDSYIDNQARTVFTEIDNVLTANPPVIGDDPTRNMALLALDVLLHDSRNDKQQPFYDFVNLRLGKMLQDLEKPVKKGVKIYKLYNDGFIMKTQTATIAIDLVPGGPASRPFINDSLIFAIADKCDAMFISHAHGDHANLRIAKAFAAQGKLVIAPKGLWTDVDPNIRQLLDADKVVTVPFEQLGMTLHILPGHQDDMYNNIYVMTFKNGISVAHTGDQYNDDDLAWIDNIHKEMKIDVLLLNCWVNSMQRTIEGFGPKLLITGHENEMEHSIDHRESYWMTMGKMNKMRREGGLKMPNVLMSWGECYWYKK